MAVQYRRFPIYSWSALAQQLSIQSPVILLGVFFSPAIAGFYAFGRRVLLEPIHILGDAIAKAFFQKVSADYRSGKDVSGMTFKLLHALAVFFIPPMVVFAAVAEPLFTLVFGKNWETAGYYATLLTPMFTSIFLLGPLSVFFDLMEKQRELGIFNLFILLVTVIVLVGGGLYAGPDLTILVFSGISTLIVINRVLWLARQAGVSVRKVLVMLAARVAVAALICMPVLLLRALSELKDPLLVLASALIVVMYFLYLWQTDPVVRGIVSGGMKPRTLSMPER